MLDINKIRQDTKQAEMGFIKEFENEYPDIVESIEREIHVAVNDAKWQLNINNCNLKHKENTVKYLRLKGFICDSYSSFIIISWFSQTTSVDSLINDMVQNAIE